MSLLLRGLAGLLALALIALVLLVAGLLFTAHGGPWAFRLATELSKGHLQADGVRGGLLNTLDIERLIFTSATEKVEIRRAHLHWNPRALRSRTLHIYALTAESVEVTTYPSPPKPFTPLPAKLPLTLRLDAARVARIVVRPSTAAEGAAPIIFEYCSAAGRWDDSGLHLHHLAGWQATAGGVGLAGNLRLEGDAVIFQPLAIVGPGRLLVQGRLGLNGRDSLLDVQGADLRWPLNSAVSQLSASTLRAQFAGRPSAGKISLTGHLRAAALPDKAGGFALKAEAQLQPKAIAVQTFSLTADDARQGQLQGSGRANWGPRLEVQASLVLRHINPALLLPEWPGSVSGKATVNTVLDGGHPRLRFAADFKDSRLRERPFALQAKGQYLAAQPPQLRLEQLALRSGSAVLTAEGQVLPTWQAQAALKAAALSDFYPGLSGSAEAKVTLVGPFKLPRVNASASLSEARFKTLRVEQALLKAALDSSKNSTATLSASKLHIGERLLRTLKLDLDGRLENHQLQLASTAAEGSVALDLRGGYTVASKIWQGSLHSAVIDAAKAPKLRLTAPAALMLSAARQTLGNACFAADAARACASGEHAGARSHMVFSLSQFALATLQPLLPKDVLVEALAEGQGQLTLEGAIPVDAQLVASLGPGRILLPQVPPLLLRSAQLSAAPAGANWTAKLKAETDRGSVEASASTPRAGENWGGRPLAGTLALNVPSIAFLQGLIKYTEALEGRVQGSVALAGSLAAPRFTGTLRLEDGAARIPVAGITLRRVSAALTGSEAGALSLVASAQSGEGTLNLAGNVSTKADGVQARITAKGENLQVADLADYRVWVSPDLVFNYAPDRASLNGTVLVPKAAITPRKLAGGVVSASPDAVVAGREKPTGRGLPIYAEVKVTLGDDVRFEGFGLKARIEGSVTAVDAPGLAVTRGRGELRVVEGRYKAYGQDLTLETGRLLFTGAALTEPTVDFRALRKPREDVAVRVLVRGTLKAPRLDLSSTPSMSREEQVSWLVLGRPLSNTTGAERSQVNSAALSLGFSGGEFLAGRLGKSLGLDEVSVGAQPGDDVTQARFTIGKYLSPRLYVSYGVGLFERNNVFRLLYDLGRGFKLRTETGLHAGGDVLYTVEK